MTTYNTSLSRRRFVSGTRQTFISSWGKRRSFRVFDLKRHYGSPVLNVPPSHGLSPVVQHAFSFRTVAYVTRT